jgi:hypothetical protein
MQTAAGAALFALSAIAARAVANLSTRREIVVDGFSQTPTKFGVNLMKISGR